jgi:hypothetical protein
MKAAKMHVVKPEFDFLFADILYNLNDARYLIYGVDGEARPVIRVQDCAFRKLPGDEKFVPRSVKLTPQQWIDLLHVSEDVKEGLEEDTNSRVHIGGNTFITVKPHMGIVDIREFFLPPDDTRAADTEPNLLFDQLIPTKRGVMLNEQGWTRLVGKGSDIVKEFAAEKIPDNDWCFSTHESELQHLACDHCNPNGYKYWKQ